MPHLLEDKQNVLLRKHEVYNYAVDALCHGYKERYGCRSIYVIHVVYLVIHLLNRSSRSLLKR